MASADEEYRVLVTYASGGDISGHLKEAKGHAEGLGHSISEIGSGVGEIGSELVHGFQHAVEHAAELVAHVVKIGAVLGVGAATYGVAHLNNELEQTNIALGAIFQAQGFAPTFEKGFALAGEQVKKMKQDVKTLPGDLGQLSDIMKMIATPGAQAGAGPDELRKLAGRTMLVGTILGVNQAQASREMAMLLSGRAGAHNVLGMRLGFVGDAAHKLTAATPVERWKEINAQLDKYGGAADRFGQSMIAQWTTLKDNIKYALIAPTTAPLFDSVKKTIGDINEWFDKNPEKVERWTSQVGLFLQYAWERGIEIADEWWPRVLQFAKDISHALESVWLRIEPVVARVAEHLKSALGDGSALKKIERILELYAVTKIGLPILSAGSHMINPAVTLAGAMGEGGALAGAGAAVGPVIGVLAVAALTVAGAFDMLNDTTNTYHDLETTMVDEIKGNVASSWRALTATADNLKPEFQTTIDMLGLFGTALADSASGITRDGLNLMEFLSKHADQMPGLIQLIAKAEKMFPTMNADDADTVERNQELHFGRAMSTSNINELYKEMYAKKAKGAGPGGGGTHIQKVEIVVNTNQDSNRVAEMVVKRLVTIDRHPQVSALVPNWSGR